MSHAGRVLVLKTGEPPSPVKAARGDFEGWIAKALGCTVADVDVAAIYAGAALPAVESVCGIVVTGSPGMVTAREDWSEASARWLAKIVEADAVPVLGLCYGHQLIAHGLGGEVGVNPRGREIGTVTADFPEDTIPAIPLFEGGLFPVHMSHVESVLVPPRDAQVLATTNLEGHAALQFGPRQWGVQFHPEFDRDIMQRYIEARREILLGEGLDPDKMIAATEETPVSTRIVGRFAEMVRGE